MKCDSLHHQQSQIKWSSAVAQGDYGLISNFWANENSKKRYNVHLKNFFGSLFFPLYPPWEKNKFVVPTSIPTASFVAPGLHTGV